MLFTDEVILLCNDCCFVYFYYSGTNIMCVLHSIPYIIVNSFPEGTIVTKATVSSGHQI